MASWKRITLHRMFPAGHSRNFGRPIVSPTQTPVGQRTQAYRVGRLVLLVTTVVLCWLACTVAQVEKYLSLPRAAAVCALGCAGIVTLLLLLRRCYHRRQDVRLWSLAVVFGLLVLSFAVLYPKSQKHLSGKGSDREDALRVELVAVTHHQYPYDARTYLNHPPSPLPGAMWLAFPFFLAGRIALQNLLWTALFFIFLTHFFRRRVTALVLPSCF